MLILASSSPRRFEILSSVTTDFKVVVSDFEEIIDPTLAPEMIVQDLALGKGREVLGRYPEDTILCGDTIVYFDGKPYGKPQDRNDAFNMLHAMSGKEAYIYTGNGILTKSKVVFEATIAIAKFDNISDEFIDTYLSSAKENWIDRAGAFAVQGDEFHFTTVVGEWETALGFSKEFLLANMAMLKS
jgi:septum formation protein